MRIELRKPELLQADLDFDCHVFVGKILTYTGLTHAIPVLMHVQEAGTATAESLSTALFPGLGPLCQRLLERCRKDGTLERRRDGYGSAEDPALAPATSFEMFERRQDEYVLTEEGRSALETGLAPERRFGAWNLCILQDHPLVTEADRMLRMEDGSQEATYNREHPDPVPLRGAVKGLLNRIVTPIFGEHERFRIDETDVHQKIFRSCGRVKLLLEVDEEGARVSLRAPDWSGGDRQVSELDLTYEDAIEGLLRENGLPWDREARRVPLSYEEADLEERLAMRKEIKLETRLSDCSFNPLYLKLDIYPRTRYDTDLWAEDMFADGIRDYMTASRLAELEAEIAETLPECRFGPAERDRCVSRLELGTPKFWFVHVAEDWGL